MMILPGVSEFVDDVNIAEADHHVRNQNNETKYDRPNKVDIIFKIKTTCEPLQW